MDFLGQPQLYIYQFLFYFVYKITTNVYVTPTIINYFTVQKKQSKYFHSFFIQYKENTG